MVVTISPLMRISRKAKEALDPLCPAAKELKGDWRELNLLLSKIE
jgi:hypothetical protein